MFGDEKLVVENTHKNSGDGRRDRDDRGDRGDRGRDGERGDRGTPKPQNPVKPKQFSWLLANIVW